MVTHGVINLAGTDEEIARWIWHNLVPKSGQAVFLQGELLRAVEKLRWEGQGNGNINWDDGFEMLIDLLADHLLIEARFSREERASITSDLERLRNFDLPHVEDDLYDRLTSSVVRFCRLNPRLVAYQHDPVQHR
jgi:hypothetical protein